MKAPGFKIGAIVITLIIAIFVACSLNKPTEQNTESNSVQNIPFIENTFNSESNNQDTGGLPVIATIGGHMAVSWPFYGWSNAGWYGWQGERTDWGTHVGADWYAHDLSSANCEGVGMYAGIAGQVVQVCNSCPLIPSNCNGRYGNTVVIYDWNRHVAVRYSHMRFVAVQLGQWVAYRQYLGTIGQSGNVTGPHLHICAYENIDHFSGGYPIIPTAADSDHYACRIDWVY